MRKSVSVALVAGTLAWLVACSVQPAHAQWGYASSGGSSGGYVVSYGSSGGSSGYSYGSSGYAVAYGGYGSSGYVGPVRRLLRHIGDSIHAHHARKLARRAAYGCSGYYYGSCGCSGYVPVGYSSCGSSGYSVSYGSYGSSGGTVAPPPPAPTPAPAGSDNSNTSFNTYRSGGSQLVSDWGQLVSELDQEAECSLTVVVPPHAKVFINDRPTTSTGRVRHYVSRGLKPGKKYRFNVRAELTTADGETLVETRELVVSGNSEESLEFAFDGHELPVETVVTLHVPDDAQVVLAGNPVKAKGPVRVFRTAKLQPGETWDDYEIEVRLGDRVKRQSVRLMAGDQLELTFSFDDNAPTDKIAAR